MSKLHCTGVYQIRNTINGKLYIGSAARSFQKRWGLHLRQLRTGKHHSRALQRAWNKYGESAFVFEILLICSPDDCIMYEQCCMDFFKSANGKCGYNTSPTAGNCCGVKHTAETRAKLSALGKGRPVRPEVLAARIGRKRSEETRAKLRDARFGFVFSEESRAKMRATRAGKKYRKRGPETGAKISAALKGKKKSPEHVKKIRAYRHSEESRAKMRAGWARRLAMLAAKQSTLF